MEERGDSEREELGERGVHEQLRVRNARRADIIHEFAPGLLLDESAKVKQLALKRSFSEKVKEGAVIVLENFELQDAKTKSAAAVLKAFKADAAKVLIAVKEYEENQLRATGNLPLAILIKAASVNTYQVVYSDKLMFTKEALDEFVKRLA